LPATPRAPDDGSQPPTWAIAILVGLFVGVPTLIEALSWFGISVSSLLPFELTDTVMIALVFSPLVVLVLVALAAKLWEAHRASKWTQTTGHITKSRVEARHHQFQGEASTVKNVPAVEYEFAVIGRTYRGARIAIGDDKGGPNLEETLARYPVGKNVIVYYDAEDPNNCVLERDIPKGLASGCLTLLAIAAAFVVGIYYATTNATRLLQGYIPEKADAPATVFITCFGLAVLVFFFAYRRYVSQAAKWPTVPGKVATSTTESFVNREDGRDRTSYAPVIEYSFNVHGIEYRSRKITIGVATSGSQRFAEGIAAKYPEGKNVTVHYDPADPSNAALENAGGYPWLLLGIALICFALAVFVSGLYR
jgi:hypothetical protein